jgi:hypothetical protein
VEDFYDLGVDEQLEKRLQAQPVGKRVDENGLIGGRGLQEAQFWPLGGFAEKFGVDGDELEFAGAGAERGERRGGGGQLHYDPV